MIALSFALGGKLLAAQVPWWAAATRAEVATPAEVATADGAAIAPAALRPLPQREASPAVGHHAMQSATTPNTAPATKSDTPISPNITPATKIHTMLCRMKRH